MLEIKRGLEEKGIDVTVPDGTEDYAKSVILKSGASGWGTMEGAKRKISKDLIRGYYREIENCDAILVINKDKVGIKNYIGGDGFLEIGFAHVLNKPIYLLNPIPEELKVFYQEIVAMQPVVIGGNLEKIKIS